LSPTIQHEASHPGVPNLVIAFSILEALFFENLANRRWTASVSGA
jgi:hypothetical protein